MMRTYVTMNSTGLFFHLIGDSLSMNFTGTYMCRIEDKEGKAHDMINITVVGELIRSKVKGQGYNLLTFN